MKLILVFVLASYVQGALRSNTRSQGLAAAPVHRSSPLALATASAPAPAPGDDGSHYVEEMAKAGGGTKKSIKDKLRDAVGSEKEVYELGQQFYARDLNGDGYLTIPEMDATDTQGNVMHAHLRDQVWFDCLDTNNNGKVTLKEWVSGCQGKYKKLQECSKERLADSKRFFFTLEEEDANKDGVLEPQEIDAGFIKTYDQEGACLSMLWMQCCDHDNNQKLNPTEWDDCGGKYSSELPGGWSAFTPQETGNCLVDGMKRCDTMYKFSVIDVSGDGRISKQESYKFMHGLDYSMSSTRADKVFEQADANKDGFIDYDEFWNESKR